MVEAKRITRVERAIGRAVIVGLGCAIGGAIGLVASFAMFERMIAVFAELRG